MSWLDRYVEKIEDYQRERGRDRHPYLMTKDGKTWFLKQELEGCRPLQVQAGVLMNKEPKPLPGATMPRPPTQPPTGSAATAPTKKLAAASSPENCTPPPPPFDMLDIPEAMERMGFHYAAYCARRWFNGRAHVAPRDVSTIFDMPFVDTESCKLKWITHFGVVKSRQEHLLSHTLGANATENIYNSPSRNQLKKRMNEFMVRRDHYYSGTLDSMDECNGDKQKLHHLFQFQRIGVSMSDVLGSPSLIMNDLAASMANFYLYAAIANAKVSTAKYMRYNTNPWGVCTSTKVAVTHIYIYAKDSYSFNDEPESKISQYLGHWNHGGVIIAADATLAEIFAKITKSNYQQENGNEPRQYLPPLSSRLDGALDIGHSNRKSEIYYPVRNRDFQIWRDAKARGGDFLIFSNFERVKLKTPIEFDLEEFCTEYKQ